MSNYPQSSSPLGYQATSLPTRPGALTAVAIIGIVIASLSLVCNGLSTILVLIGSVATGTGAPKPSGMMIGAGVALGVLSVIIAIVWLVISIMLLRVAAWSRKAGVTYALVHIALIVLTTAFQLIVIAPESKKMTEAQLAANPDPNVAKLGSGVAAAGVYGGTVLWALCGFILPVTMLIGLTRPSVVAAFGAEVPPGPGYQPQYPGQ